MPALAGSATFGSITRAIFGSLQAMHVDAGGPFANVVRTAVDKMPQGAKHQLGALPAIEFPAGESKAVVGINPVINHQQTFIVTTTWHVWINARALVGSGDGIAELLLEDLVDLIEASLAGLPIPGLYLNEKLVYLGSVKTELSRGMVRRCLAFTTRHVLYSQDVLEKTVPFSGVQGNVFKPESELADPFKSEF